MIELYEEKYFEIHDPVTARLVALFTDENDAKAYVEWRNKKKFLKVSATEVAGVDDSGIGLVVNQSGERGIFVTQGSEHFVIRISDAEARHLAAQIDAALTRGCGDNHDRI